MTKRTVKQKSKRTKRAATPAQNQPVDAEIRRAAERAGISEETGLAPSEHAAVEERRKIGLPVSDYGLNIVKLMRERGAPTESVRAQLRYEASGLEDLAERLTPEPEVRDAMLTDALEIVEAAASIFEHQGDDSDLLAEALRSASDDFELFESASVRGNEGPEPMAYLRAEFRIALALKIDAFRRKHPSWKPAKVGNEESETEQAMGGAS